MTIFFAAMGATSSKVRRGRPIRTAMIVGLLLHSVAVVWLWLAWQPGLRGSWLVWLDFPLSLLWAASGGGALLFWSLLAGGLYWAALAGLLALLAGRLSARRQR